MRIFLILTICLLGSSLYAQRVDSLRHVQALGKATNRGIKLRWAVSDATSWVLANKYGYTIDRYTILRDSKLLQKVEKIRLTSTPVKPASQAAWDKAIDTNDFAAVAAQAIFGDSFEATTGKQTDVAQIINRTKELEQRFSFALFAADHSFEAATLSGLAWVDSTARNNEKYLYKVYTNIPKATLRLDTGLVYINKADLRELPKPMKLSGQFNNRVVSLKWPVTLLRSIYVSYKIERSENNVNFEATSKLPFINTDPRSQSSDYFVKLDSLPQNGKTFYFRIRGVDSFGDLGPPSDVISGMGENPIHCDVAITKAMENKAAQVDIQWKITCETEATAKDVLGYNVSRAPRAEGPYIPITKKTLTADITNFRDPMPQATNYYVVTMVGKGDKTKTSFPYMVQLADSIPPAVPQGVTAKIDTAGIVTIQWTANSERDLLGYRVYRSNFENSEYGLATTSAINVTTFRDTVNIKTLTKKVFYKVVSEDTHNNKSPFSKVVVLDRPDHIPPVAPRINSIESTMNGVVITGISSSSDDVVRQELYQRVQGTTNWKLIKAFTGDSLAYIDGSADAFKGSDYAWMAIDKAGNKSALSQSAFGKRTGNRHDVIKSFRGAADRTDNVVRINWAYTEKDVIKYHLFKAAGEGALTFYKTLQPMMLKFDDENVKMNTIYKYRIKAIFRDGTESNFSEELSVSF